MKKFYIQLFTLILIALDSYASPLILTKQEKNYIINNPIVTIGMMPDFSTFSYIKDKKNIGFEHDLVQIISLKTGLKFNKKINNWPMVYDSFKKGQTDMIASISYTQYRSDFTLYTTPYYHIPISVFTRDDYKDYRGLHSLKGKRVGIIKNVFFEHRLKKISGLKIVYYNSYEKIIKDLFSGYIDVVIDNLPSIQKITKKQAYTNIIEVERLMLSQSSKEDLRFGIQKDNILLHSIIQKTLDSISEKSYTKLSEKWLLSNYTKPINYVFLFAIIMGTLASMGIILYLMMRKKNKELTKLAITDKLTNLYNRRQIEKLIQTEINRSQRFKSNFALVILDIDYFKDVNDTYGHQVGDIVLTEFANILKDTLRKTDFIGRFGGEEFMIICPEIGEIEIFKVIESLRLKIANFDFEKVGHKTASFGITIYKDTDTLDSIIKRADDALYEAKNSGRNRSILYT